MASQSNFMLNFKSTTGDPVSPRGKAPRSSLACLPCRSRHVKCDGKQPNCSRCAEAGQICNYTKSRRGGLDRAALAQRRKRLAATNEGPDTSGQVSEVQLDEVQGDNLQSPNPPCIFAQMSMIDGQSFIHSTASTDRISSLPSPASSPVSVFDIEHDSLLELYYKDFHKFHPFVLPWRHLTRYYRDPSTQLSIRPLVAVLRFIGHLYGSHEWSSSLNDIREASFQEASQLDPILVQCRLLYSIVLFWFNYKTESRREMDAAVQLALSLKMSYREFAVEHGRGDPVLAECWRRTWWMIYIVDAYYEGTLGTMNFSVTDVEITVELPCEETEYESGNIPEPKTLHDFDCREFSESDVSFSSFAYLIGAVRCTALAISTAPKITAKEASPHLIHNADSCINGWLLSLPKSRKQIMAKNGEIDELMFQAHLLIHVSVVGLHRPLSDLKFSAKESVSSCAREPPLDTPTPELINIHTVRVLRSSEATAGLLALCSQPFNHTPFTTCMVSEGTLALLSACKYHLKGTELAIARDRIRMIIGCLRALGEIWPRTARNLQEIKIIARHVIELGPPGTFNSTPEINDASSRSISDGQLSLEPESGALSDDFLTALSNVEDICGWYGLGEQDPVLNV